MYSFPYTTQDKGQKGQGSVWFVAQTIKQHFGLIAKHSFTKFRLNNSSKINVSTILTLVLLLCFEAYWGVLSDTSLYSILTTLLLSTIKLLTVTFLSSLYLSHFQICIDNMAWTSESLDFVFCLLHVMSICL